MFAERESEDGIQWSKTFIGENDSSGSVDPRPHQWSTAHCPQLRMSTSQRSCNNILLKISFQTSLFVRKHLEEVFCSVLFTRNRLTKCLSLIVTPVVSTALLLTSTLHYCQQRKFYKQTDYFSMHLVSILFKDIFFNFVHFLGVMQENKSGCFYGPHSTALPSFIVSK